MEIKAKYIKVEIIEGNSSYSLEADIKRWLNNHSDDTIYDIDYRTSDIDYTTNDIIRLYYLRK